MPPSDETTADQKHRPSTHPAAPEAPSFAPPMGLLVPCYLIGDSAQDKCVKMLSAALEADGETALEADGETAWARDGFSFAPAAGETAFRCLFFKPSNSVDPE